MLKAKTVETTTRHLELTIDEDVARLLLELLESNTSDLDSILQEMINDIEDFLHVEPKEEKRQPKQGETIRVWNYKKEDAEEAIFAQFWNGLPRVHSQKVDFCTWLNWEFIEEEPKEEKREPVLEEWIRVWNGVTQNGDDNKSEERRFIRMGKNGGVICFDLEAGQEFWPNWEFIEEEKREPEHGETIWVWDDNEAVSHARFIHLNPIGVHGVLAHGTKKGKLGRHVWPNWTFYK